jgi:putative DNA primase/helicase
VNLLIPIPIDDPLQMAWLDLNDLGNAERLVRLAKGLLLWVEDLGSGGEWAAYDGQRWSVKDGERKARQLAHDVARHIDREAAMLDLIADDYDELVRVYPWFNNMKESDLLAIAGERVTKLRVHAVKSGDASRTNAMLLQSQTLISAFKGDFDTDPLALNLQNGTLRFFQDEKKKWTVRCDPHDPEDRLMQIAGVEYREGAKSPRWSDRMKLVQPQKDQRDMLQQIYGYTLTGLISEQKWFLYQGKGGDGKSATNEVVSKMLGDYARHANIQTFLEGAQRSGSDHSSDLARLAGDIRFVLCEEPNVNSTWDGMRLKQVTGSTVTARAMREAEIEYKARWKLFIEVNPLPAVPNDDDGFWRRVVQVPWKFQFDKGSVAAQPMEIIVQQMMDEGPGILNWMITGALKWLETRRLPISAASTEAVASYRRSTSTFSEWMEECCDTSDSEAATLAKVLYDSFKAFCEAAGIEKVETQTKFGRRLRDRMHLEGKDGRGNRTRKGIRLKTDGIGGGLGAAAAPSPAPASPPPPGMADPDPAYPPLGEGGRAAPQARGDFGADDIDYGDDDMPI